LKCNINLIVVIETKFVELEALALEKQAYYFSYSRYINYFVIGVNLFAADNVNNCGNPLAARTFH